MTFITLAKFGQLDPLGGIVPAAPQLTKAPRGGLAMTTQ